MTRSELLRELAAVDERINTAYWAFTRTARGKPPAIVCPDAYARRAELRRLLYSEYLTVEIDTEAKTCVVVKARA